MRRVVMVLGAVFLLGATVAVSAQEADELTWVRTGGPLGGLGYDVRMMPGNPDIMFVTDAFAGVNVSRDGGATWSPSNDGITSRSGTSGDSIPIFCLTIDPSNPDVLWAGTQNTRGIFKSTDGGRTWQKTDRGIVEEEGITFRGISVDPGDSDVVYAAAELASWVWAGEPREGREFDLTGGVVYKTTNGGESWSRIWQGDNLARYVLIDPQDTDTLYVSTGIFDREAANSDPGPGRPGGVGVLKSTDGGTTWEEPNVGLGNLYVGSLAMHPTDPRVLLAGTGNNQYFLEGGVYRTDDGAATWSQVLSEHPEGGNINSVEFATADIAYAAGAGAVYRSEDGGHNWRKVSPEGTGWGSSGVRAGFPIDIEVDPRDPDRLFINNYGGGNFMSPDGGRSWSVASDGYTGAQTRDIAVNPDQPGRAYVASRSGLFVTRDGGSRWGGRAFPPEALLEFQSIAASGSGDRVIASSTWLQGIAVSGDAGETWRFTSVPLGHNQAFRALTFAPTDPGIAWAGVGAFFSAGGFDPALPGGGVYSSHDGGETWRPANDAVSSDAQVIDIAPHPGNPDRVFAATGTGLILTVNGGASWAPVDGLPGGIVASVAIDPHDPAVVLVGLGPGPVYRSEDGGETWVRSSEGLSPESAVLDLVFDPAVPGVVWAADIFSGVYRSDDRGVTWRPISAGLDVRAAQALSVSGDGRHVYAATEGGGVYRLDLDGAPPQALAAPTATTAPRATTAPPTTTTSPTSATAQPGGATSVVAAPSDGGDDGTMGVVLVAAMAAVAAALGVGFVVGRRRARRR